MKLENVTLNERAFSFKRMLWARSKREKRSFSCRKMALGCTNKIFHFYDLLLSNYSGWTWCSFLISHWMSSFGHFPAILYLIVNSPYNSFDVNIFSLRLILSNKLCIVMFFLSLPFFIFNQRPYKPSGTKISTRLCASPPSPLLASLKSQRKNIVL